jgi:hypothetical protein
MTAADFRPSRHGFPYPNSFPRGTPVVKVWTPLGTLNVGDASGGVCGGMVFAAADFFTAGQPIPDQSQPSPKLFDYFCKRLLDSWHLPFGAMKYYDWQRRPTRGTTWCGVPVVDGTQSLTLAVEWPRVRSRLNSGLFAPLGLVKASGLNPARLGQHHQVLAYAYHSQDSHTILRIYDPNYPGDDDCTLSVETDNPDADAMIVHSCEGPVVRGFFSVDYEPMTIAW